MEGGKTFTKRESLDQFASGTLATDRESAVTYILSKLEIPLSDANPLAIDQLRASLSALRTLSKNKLNEARRTKSRFESTNKYWLASEFKIPCTLVEKTLEQSSGSSGAGRPRLSFAEKSLLGQMREAAGLSKQESTDLAKLLLAARHLAKSSGKRDLLCVLSEALKSPNRPTKIRKKIFRANIIPYSPDEALALVLDLSLSKAQYQSLRLESIARNADIYPAYNLVRKAKCECRPGKEFVFSNEVVAEVNLQALLNHTASRIALLQTEVIAQALTKSNVTHENAELICLYGFDGSSGHSTYKQKFKRDTEANDASIFAITLIPLRLSTPSGLILWNNRSPQSPCFCRPIKLQLKKESEELVQSEKGQLDNLIANLQNFTINLGPRFGMTVNYSLFLTLIDGKILNYLTGTRSSQSCPICHATPKLCNDLSNLDNQVFSPEPNSLQYGISPLHSWIRMFECCLHIVYRIGNDPPTWQMRTPQQKLHLKERKSSIGQEVWKQLS